MTPAEHAEKRGRLLALLDRAGLDGLLLTRPANVAWYLGGARVHVEITKDLGVAEVLVTREGDHLYTDVIEAGRLQEEEIGPLALEVHARPWQADRLEQLPLAPGLGADAPVGPCRPVGDLVARERAPLTVEEATRYAAAGAAAAQALGEVALALGPQDSERQAAARMAAALHERGLEPLALMVGGETRARVRHPLPTGARLGARAMLVTCARREGLVCSLTRIVAFGALSAADRDREARLLAVEAAYLGATRPGRRVADILAAGLAAYGEHGFDADEGDRHHQGGPTGYETRDELATVRSEGVAEAGQAFAWNPSAEGLKVEDTVLTTPDGPPAVLTSDPAWPTVEVGGLRRPAVLER